MNNPITKRILVYSEGVLSHSKHNPRVISGEIPKSEPVITRTEWVRWQWWAERITDHWLGFLSRHIPGAKWLVFETYETHYYPIFREKSRSRPIRIPRADALPRWQLFINED